ncbi:2Fe-2S iron-sulfur cluster-binding protein [Xylophilus sp. GOD-11R]|uniref:2Fe-2S iron-sulfur cluster-binding protein n=1 Tax=Xylophilus sp. GOD-11R TaxID=3089814 RepID=UPI00298CA464|nr:2Fe-2S iron-sulfur cluster-binding protein [Xylophilus sp. GOD-11R]WPB56141.1 2Fe-2S iron-sulfur cluster-binding protein [Xylophilus sp. GOD-11R]
MELKPAAAATTFTLRVEPQGWQALAPADVPLLLAAERAGIDMPSSCRNGTCRACLCLKTSGEVTYRIDWPGLSRDEKIEGYVLPCAAYALSDVVLQQPAARRAGPTR